MNWQAFAGNPWKYGGHGTSLGITKQESLAYLEKSNLEATALLEKLPDADLTKKISDLANNSTTAWRILMATVEHEIHHRSQLASYLYLMGVEPPQLYGVYMEKLPKT